MKHTRFEIRSGAYYDSVVLMQLQRALADLPGVDDAGVVMATPANKELLLDGDLLPAEADKSGPDDLLIVIRADGEAEAVEAIGQVDALLASRRSTVVHEFKPRSMSAAAKHLPDADWVLISVPGRYAADVALEALELGKHVFLYSDNVALADEIELKQTARERGLLVMGPDCGTAMVNGIGLGFANRVRRGSIGIVGASGTGLQAIMAGIHNNGGGVSQAIGTGGRDLNSEVGAATALQGLALLTEDDETSVIVLVSKPPDSAIAVQLLSTARNSGKPVVIQFVGYAPPGRRIGNLHFAVSLSEAAEVSIQLSDSSDQFEESEYRSLNTDYWLRGLFSGGTLAYEATLALGAVLQPLYSNVPVHAEQKLPVEDLTAAHVIFDLGADEFTVGRLHPMMDNDLRIRRMRREAADPNVGLILLDVVLGEGAHADPASELGPAIADCLQIAGERLEVVALVVGTDEDPQDLEGQIAQLQHAGARVFDNLTDIADYISNIFSASESDTPTISLDTLRKPLAAINVGLESFYDSLTDQGAAAVQMDWRPPAGGNEKLMDILAKMKSK